MPLSRPGRREIHIYYLPLMCLYAFLHVINISEDYASFPGSNNYQMTDLDSDLCWLTSGHAAVPKLAGSDNEPLS